VRKADGLGSGDQLQHQIGTENSLHMLESLKMTDPDGRHSIWHNQKRICKYQGKIMITKCFHDAMDTGDTYIPLSFVRHGGLDCLYRHRHVDGVDS
jgi:hypothetical protein